MFWRYLFQRMDRVCRKGSSSPSSGKHTGREKAKRALYISAGVMPWHQCGCVAQCQAGRCCFTDYPGLHYDGAGNGAGEARAARKWVAEVQTLIRFTRTPFRIG